MSKKLNQNELFNKGIPPIRPLQTRGHVQVPAEVRKKMKISPGDQIAFIQLDSEEYLIRKVDAEALASVLIDHKSPYDSSK
jgi:AbrB family looped-hinge helix DNA binding protein